jgi:hypothetical protein
MMLHQLQKIQSMLILVVKRGSNGGVDGHVTGK